MLKLDFHRPMGQWKNTILQGDTRILGAVSSYRTGAFDTWKSLQIKVQEGSGSSFRPAGLMPQTFEVWTGSLSNDSPFDFSDNSDDCARMYGGTDRHISTE